MSHHLFEVEMFRSSYRQEEQLFSRRVKQSSAVVVAVVIALTTLTFVTGESASAAKDRKPVSMGTKAAPTRPAIASFGRSADVEEIALPSFTARDTPARPAAEGRCAYRGQPSRENGLRCSNRFTWIHDSSPYPGER